MADFDGRILVRRSCIASKKRSQGKGDGVMALTRKLLRRHAAAVSGGTVTAIEGSAGVSGDADGRAVMRRTRISGRIACGARPGYPDLKRRARPNRTRLRANISQNCRQFYCPCQPGTAFCRMRLLLVFYLRALLIRRRAEKHCRHKKIPEPSWFRNFSFGSG